VRPRVLGGAVLLLLVAGLAVYGWQGMVRVRELRAELRALERENVALREQAQRLTQVIDRLRNDPAYLERIAREERGMVRPGETVLKFPSRDKAGR
jgi:cell division protein FtsB